MDTFIVSARKYRPQNFNTVVGQSHITTTLKNAIKNQQLAHAFLFCGPRGVGKTTCARILAKTINCTQVSSEGEACNTCNSCVSFDAGSSMNIHELDAASNNSVEDIRSLVDQVRFAPQAGKYKVYIVDEVHMLSTSAFNAFLKTLEEPPSYAIFILATTEKHKILPTILSRCQIFDFKRITTNDTVEHLQEIVNKESIEADKASLQIIAQKSEGCMRDALSILDKIVSFTNSHVTYQNTLEHLNILDHDYYFKLLSAIQRQDMAEALLLYDEINQKGFEGDLVLNGFAECIRNILVCKDAKASALLDVVEGMQAKYTQVAATISAGYLVSALNILNEAEIQYKMARNKRLHVELVLIKLNFLQQALTLSMQDEQIIKKKRIDSPISIKPTRIPSIQMKPMNIAKVPSTSSLHIQQTPPIHNTVSTASPTNTLPSNNYANASIEEKADAVATNSNNTAAIKENRSLLDVLRDKYGNRYSIQEVENPIPLTTETLENYWQHYAEKLQEERKHSQVMAFKQAQLKIENEAFFTITVNSTLQQKFIEQEKPILLDYLQRHYHNRSISFGFIVEEDGEPLAIPLQQQLSSKQRFERIAQQYPLIKALRNNLKLDIG